MQGTAAYAPELENCGLYLKYIRPYAVELQPKNHFGISVSLTIQPLKSRGATEELPRNIAVEFQHFASLTLTFDLDQNVAGQHRGTFWSLFEANWTILCDKPTDKQNHGQTTEKPTCHAQKQYAPASFNWGRKTRYKDTQCQQKEHNIPSLPLQRKCHAWLSTVGMILFEG